MKMTIRICSFAIAIAGFSSVSYGQATASAATTARIVTPISISKDVDMNFGDASVQSSIGVMLSVSGITINDGNAYTMTVNNFTCSPTAMAGLLTAGTQTLNVGATLNIGAAQIAGTYASATPFDVTVNYN